VCTFTRRTGTGALDPGLAPGSPMRVEDARLSGGGVFADGSALLVTSSTLAQSVALRRTTPDGKVDATFGASGVLTLPFPQVAVASRQLALVGTDGLLTVMTLDGSSNGVMARYDRTGAPDPGFGSGGTVTWPASHYPYAVVEQEGQLVVAEYSDTNIEQSNLVRVSKKGARDMTFGTGGVIALLRGGIFPMVTVQPDGALVVKRLTPSPTVVTVLERFDKGGKPDATFGGGAAPVVPIGFDAQSSFVVSSRGEIYVAGVKGERVVVVRYRANGELDVGFGEQGSATGPLGSAVMAIAVQPSDGKLVVAAADRSSPTKAFLTRFWP
jgi:uncharacterized delta-60 repeat protein